MASGRGRKRPWEETDLTDSPQGGRLSTPLPPLSGLAGRSSSGARLGGSRVLPQLLTATVHTTENGREQEFPDLQTRENGGISDSGRPEKAQSLSRPLRIPQPQSHNPGPDPATSSYVQQESPSPFASSALPAPPAADGVSCCPPSCPGPSCSELHSSLRELFSEVLLLDARVQSTVANAVKSSTTVSDLDHISVNQALNWAIKVLRWNNLRLLEPIPTSAAQAPKQAASSEASAFSDSALDQMKRRQESMEGDPPLSSQNQLSSEFLRLPPPPGMAEDRRVPHRHDQGQPQQMGSPQHQAPSSAGSSFMRAQSPGQTLQGSHMLPSPSSLNFPVSTSMHAMSPPTTVLQSPAHAAHLQDLQHQISIKTLAFQTLQREYDSLLQKLERQRAKCATLEKKFEVSDIEINTLTDEKEKLQAQVSHLEAQVEELQQSRDEARRQIAANGSQYMKIVEMASRLQAQGAEEKRKWATEKDELQSRIKILEEAMVTGVMPDSDTETQMREHGESVASDSQDEEMSDQPQRSTQSVSTSGKHSDHTIKLLRSEIAKLRARTQSLESALQVMKQEGLSMQAAAQAIADSGKRAQDTVASVLGG